MEVILAETTQILHGNFPNNFDFQKSVKKKFK